MEQDLLSPIDSQSTFQRILPAIETNNFGFDGEVNTSLHTNVSDSQTNVIESIVGGATATVVDIGASIWNSLPGTTNVSTENLLANISGDALKVYQQNPELIQTLSFIGGSIIPGTLALKGLNAARAGAKGVSFFSNAGKVADLAKAEELILGAGKATTEYRQLTRSIFAKSAINQGIDAVVTEAAVVASLNAHPLLEDYFKDPVKNFSIGVAFGGVLGGTLGVIADNFALKQVTGKAVTGVLDNINEAVRPVLPSMTNATALQTMKASIGNLDNIIEASKLKGGTAITSLEHGIAEKIKLQLEADQIRLFDSISGPTLNALPIDTKKAFVELLSTDNKFWGVNAVEAIKESSVTKPVTIKGLVSGVLDKLPILKKADDTGAVNNVKAVHFPESGAFGTEADIPLYAGLASLGKTEEQLAASISKNAHRFPNLDSTLESLTKSSAVAESEFAAWTVKLGKMDDDTFSAFVSKANISMNDLPLMQAIVTRAEKSGAVLRDLKVRVADNTILNQRIVAERNAALSAKTGVPVDYQKSVDNIFTDASAISQFDPIRATINKGAVSQEAKDLLSAWIGGEDVVALREASSNYFATQQPGSFASSAVARNSAKAERARQFGEIYNSPGSVDARAAFSKLADADGNVLLYRGVRTDKLSGSAPLESMATSPIKAQQFAKGGQINVFKVQVEDIVAVVKDIGLGSNNVEVIVRAPARDAQAVLSPTGKVKFVKELEGAINSGIDPSLTKNALNLTELKDTLLQEKVALIDQMFKQGFPLEAIAKKANITKDSLEQYAVSPKGIETFKNLEGSIAFKSIDDVTKANDPRNLPLLLSGNKDKADYTQFHAALNRKTLHDINDGIAQTTMFASNNPAVKELAALRFDTMKNALDIAMSHIGRANNELAGNRFFNSVDFFTRNMGDVGPVFSAMGREIARVRNNEINRVVKPITEAMSAVATDRVALTEMNILKNLNDSLADWRTFKDGQLMQKVRGVDINGNTIERLEAVKFNGQEFRVKSESVIKLMESIQEKSAELLGLANAANKIKGTPGVNDIGLWMPFMNPADKFIAYVHNAATDTTQLLQAATEAGLADKIKTFSSSVTDPNIRIITKSDQANFSVMNGRLDTVHMKQADISQQKTGSGASAIPSITTNVLSEIAGGYEHFITSQIRNLADLSMDNITHTLDTFSSINKAGVANQPLSFVKETVNRPKDAAASLKNILLGDPALGEFAGWKSLNQSFETGISMATNAISTVWNDLTRPAVKASLKGTTEIDLAALKKADYEKFSKELAARGVVNPFAAYDEAVAVEKFGVASLLDVPDSSKRVVFASNALSATMLLRVGELAQPLVNMMSLPILTMLATSTRQPASFLGAQKGTANVSGVQIMYEGIRASLDPAFKHRTAAWEAAGYFKPLVSEVSDIARISRSFEKGAVAKLENALDSSLVKTLSTAADYSEALVRKSTMHTGAVLAKRLYPELDETGITIFARDFMDKAVGNFSAAQRPAFFQGTLGVALGLFQTYSLTLAQQIYRNLELKDFKTLGKAMLTQSTIFGAGSLPGFTQVSNAIGENFSDSHVDLTTGSYRALGDPAAELLLYGLPSNLGPAFFTRGDSTPRLPNILTGGVSNIASVNILTQGVDFVKNIATAVGQGNESAGQAIAQAVSLQNMSRPLARGAELVGGFSVTRAGNTVQTPEEIYTTVGVIARVLGTRPLEEAKLREADHLRSFYGSVDFKRRQEVINKLRIDIRAGEVTQEKISQYAEEYMRKGGTPTGWASAINTALGKTETAGKEVFLDKLKPDSPLNFMISTLN